MGKNMVQS